MNGLLFLSSEDFYVNDHPSEKLLCSHVNQGLLLVLFYSTQCDHCKKAIPIFRELPQRIHGCSFGMINVSTNAKVVHLSRTTISPIQYVPLIVLYVNGEPYYKYKGSIALPDIQQFVVQMSQLLESKQRFVNQPAPAAAQPLGKEKRIPEYSIGIPYCDEDVCYLEYDDAYEKKSN
jgi:thioredoxin-like negative regulator of GroEL